jgi:hypothetical protein
MADTIDLKSIVARRAGSSPARATNFLYMTTSIDLPEGRIISHFQLSEEEISLLGKLMAAYIEVAKIQERLDPLLADRGYAMVYGRGDCVIVRENQAESEAD